MGFKFIPHTSDVKFEASGKDLNELFASSAKALFSAMLDLKNVKPLTERKIEVKANDTEHLLHDWLEELIFIFDTESLVLSKFEVKIKGNTLSAKASGEPLDRQRHQPSVGVKAVAYSPLEVKKTKAGYKATVVVDV